MTKYGFSDESWEKAKKEACTVLADVARRKDTIAYSELVAKIGAIHLEPHDYAVREFLGEISAEEHDRGRGMLSAVVTYKMGDQMPGPGFFELARELGYRFKDNTEFWIQELNRVYAAWSSKKQ